MVGETLHRRADAATGADRAGFEIEAAGFSVEGRPLLRPTSLSLERGRVYGLIGHNGSGKSTLLKLLSRQHLPTEGAIRFGGRPLASWSTRAFARHVALLPQHTAAAAGLTVRELVSFGRYPWRGPFARLTRDDEARIAAALRLAEVESLAGRLVETLSGGERQRAWIAMLVAQDTDFLLLDEPISALDVAYQVEVLDLIRKLARERGAGVLVVLHDINMAARSCDELIALRGGAIVARGGPAEIVRADKLEAIYGLAMSVTAHPVSGVPVALPQ